MSSINEEKSISQEFLDDTDAKLDNIQLSRPNYINGLIKSLIFTAIAALFFFVPINISGSNEILFGFIYNYMIDLFGIFGIWLVSLIIIGNVIAFIYAKTLAKENSKIKNYYKTESTIYLVVYIIGAIYSLMYTLHVTFPSLGISQVFVGEDTGGLMSAISLAVFWVIPLGSILIPFFVSYGAINFIGTLVTPIMRPIFKVPGKSAVDAITSFLTSSSVAVLITSKLYKSNIYTVKESTLIATGFSAVSIGYAAVVINTAGLMDHFFVVYITSFIIALFVAMIAVRIPPISRKSNDYFNGRAQTDQERIGEKYHRGIFKSATNRAVKQAYTADNFFKETGRSLRDGLAVLPKVLGILFTVGVTCLIIAEYTSFFDIIGMVFVPLLNLLQIPNAMIVAPAIIMGIAEMFLPVLMIADSIDTVDIGARYFITVISMVQMIFFVETAPVMLSTGLRIKAWELVVLFFQRTLIAIPIAAIFMHLLF